MEKIVKMLNELKKKRESHPAIKLLSERVEETVAVGVETAKFVAGVEELPSESTIKISTEATQDEAITLQLELLWDIRDSLAVSTPNVAPVAWSEPSEGNIYILAGELYEEYCAAVGGFAHDGHPLPTWEEFRADPSKNKQSDAWMQVAGKAIAILA